MADGWAIVSFLTFRNIFSAIVFISILNLLYGKQAVKNIDSSLWVAYIYINIKLNENQTFFHLFTILHNNQNKLIYVDFLYINAKKEREKYCNEKYVKYNKK